MPQNSRIYFIWAGKPSIFFHVSKSGPALKSVSLHLCTLLLFNELFLYTRASERTGVWNSFALQIIRTITIPATFFPMKIAEIICHWGWVPSIVFVYNKKVRVSSFVSLKKKCKHGIEKNKSVWNTWEIS